jgi:hypothetical protein
VPQSDRAGRSSRDLDVVHVRAGFFVPESGCVEAESETGTSLLVVEQLAVNCNQILYTAYEAIFETSLLDAARRQLHCSYATGGLDVMNFVNDAPTLFRMATQRAVWFQEDSTPEQRRDEKREAQQQTRTRAYDNWRASPDAGRRIEHLLNEGPQHWSTTLPAHPALKMSDAAVKVGAGTMFGIAYDVTPSDVCPNRTSLAREEVFNHVLTCATCAARFRYHRHDVILRVMKKVAEEYGVLCSLSYNKRTASHTTNNNRTSRSAATATCPSTSTSLSRTVGVTQSKTRY